MGAGGLLLLLVMLSGSSPKKCPSKKELAEIMGELAADPCGSRESIPDGALADLVAQLRKCGDAAAADLLAESLALRGGCPSEECPSREELAPILGELSAHACATVGKYSDEMLEDLVRRLRACGDDLLAAALEGAKDLRKRGCGVTASSAPRLCPPCAPCPPAKPCAPVRPCPPPRPCPPAPPCPPARTVLR
jgi:hypothetical protein